MTDGKNINEEILERVKDKRLLISTIEIRRFEMVGHLILHNNFISNIIEEKIEGKRGK